jgi:1-acyl-sn-glycerol-3-phosphate acyltransferase
MIARILKTFWTSYALLIFILVGSVFSLLEFLLFAIGPPAYRAAHRWPAYCARVMIKLWGIQVKEHNKKIIENLPQCVIVINHRSDLDALVATGYMPDIYKFIGKQELVNYPFIGKLVEKLYITVDRRSENSRRQSLRNMKKQSNRGAHIVVFPEGWSNFSKDYLLDFKKGAFKVALDLQLPILVCTMTGTHELFPKPRLSLRPGKIDVYWEELISCKGLTFETHEELIKDQVRQSFLKRLKTKYPLGYPYTENQMDFKTWMNKQLAKKEKRQT